MNPKRTNRSLNAAGTTIALIVTIVTLTLSDLVEALARSSRHFRKRHRPLSQKQRRSGGKHNRATPLDVELDLWKNNNNAGYTYIVGSDDSGGGCIAGPIVTASVCLLQQQQQNDHNGMVLLQGVADSKDLLAEERERLYQQITSDDSQSYIWSYATRSNEEIDKLGVAKATMECFQESIEQLVKKIHNLDPSSLNDDQAIYSIVDGKRSPANLTVRSRPWIRGKLGSRIFFITLIHYIQPLTMLILFFDAT